MTRTRKMMNGKIHRATVTDANLDYVGSISIDPVLLEAADILSNEMVHVLDITNGSRLETYAIPGAPGEVCLNGAAAHLVDVGDLVIVVSYCEMGDEEARQHRPSVVLVDESNCILTRLGEAAA
jgi:aspartate 1-decarboxylase